MRNIFRKVLTNFIGPLGIIAVGILIAVSFILFKAKTPKIPPQEKSWPIESIQASPQTLAPELLLHGRIESRQFASLKGAVTAYVNSTPALEGQKVSAGETLLKLDPIDAELILEQRQAEVQKIESELLAERNRKLSDESSLKLEEELVNLLTKSVKREQKLSKQSLASQSRVEEAELAAVREQISVSSRELALKNYDARLKQLEANLAKATADRNLAKLNVQRTKIKAPFNGIISKRLVAIGDRVQANELLLEMYSIDELEIRAQIASERLKVIQNALDQKASLKGKIIGDDSNLKIQLDRLAGEIELDEGGIDALFVINEKNPPLRIGQAIKLKLLLPAQENVLALPNTALFETQDETYIYEIIEKDSIKRLKSTSVELVGVKFKGEQTHILVRSSSPRSLNVLTTRLPYARDGLKVELRGS